MAIAATIAGIFAIIIGALNFTGSIVRANKNQQLESHQYEMNAIGWFILAALCLR